MKRKKVIISAIAVLILLAVGVGVFFGVREYNDGRMKFTVSDTLPDGNGRRARVILLGGQSNASGCSRDDYLKKNVTPEKYAEYEAGYGNVYINYFATGTNSSDGFVRCSVRQGEGGGFFGPELGLAERLSELYPDELFFIIKCAWGGSNLHSQWLSPSAQGRTGRMYKSFVEYVETSMEYLLLKGYDAKIEGMCWMQGESDSFSVEAATEYGDNLSKLIEDIRKKFSRYSAEDGLAFVDAYIAATPAFWVHYELVNQSKDEVAKSSDMNALVDTISAGLTCDLEPEGAPDIPHYDSMSQIKLGRLFADELVRFLD